MTICWKISLPNLKLLVSWTSSFVDLARVHSMAWWFFMVMSAWQRFGEDTVVMAWRKCLMMGILP